jgi:hypothetical protein
MAIPDPTGGGGGEEELLAQIRALLDQYLAMGSDTPVAPEAEALAASIDSAMGGGGEEALPPEMGGMPPEAGGMPPDMGAPPPDAGGMLPTDESPMPDIAGMMPEGGMPTSSPGRNPLRGASDAAMEDILKRTKKGTKGY